MVSRGLGMGYIFGETNKFRNDGVEEMVTDTKLVCFLDVLGFESRLSQFGLDPLRKKYNELIDFVKAQTGGLDIARTPDGHVAVGWLVLGNAYFSDTILFWCNYNEMVLPSFTDLISEAICRGIEIDLPLRGAIAIGEADLDPKQGVFLGTPLVEAARTEAAQRWIGASFGPSLASQRYNKGFHLDTVLPFKSHYKDPTSAFATGMVVDWPRRWRQTRKSDVRPLIEAMNTHPIASPTMKLPAILSIFQRRTTTGFELADI